MRKLLLAAAAALSLTALVSCGKVIERPVRIMLAEGEGYTVLSENPLLLTPGEDASFQIELKEGYTFVPKGGMTLTEDGTLSVSRVLYPTTLTPDVRDEIEYCNFYLDDPMRRGHLTTTAAPGEVILGQQITLTATPQEGYIFSGWTDRSGKVVISEDARYSFDITGDVTLHARFSTEEELEALLSAPKIPTALLAYNMNGGTCRLGGAVGDMYYQNVLLEYYKYPNCLGDLDYFVRDGYHLVEYNTKADGTGEGYSLGSKILLPEGELAATLYCIWLKETELSAFTYTEKDDEITITGYKGEHDTVVIPKMIDGKPVTRIAANAFKGCRMTTLSLPTTLRTIDVKAFQNCKDILTMYFPDTVESVLDTSFANCVYHNFYLNAAMEPRYGPGVSRKFEALVSTQDQNRIIVVSGSSSWTGLASTQLQEAFENQYYVVNYGTNAGTPATMYMEMISHFVHEGDIVVQAPEHSGSQIGSVEMTWKMYRETEAYYNIFRYIDAANYTAMLTAFTEHQKTRLPMGVASYTGRPGNYDEHGDMTSDRSKLNDPKYTSAFNITHSKKSFTQKYIDTLNAWHQRLIDAGATVYFSFAPHNHNGLTALGKKEETKREYTEFLKENLNVPVISYVGDYTLEGQFIHDSDWHPNDVGRQMRTEQLEKDMRAQMIKDGILTE